MGFTYPHENVFNTKKFSKPVQILPDGLNRSPPRDGTDIDSILLPYEGQQCENSTRPPTPTPTPPTPPPPPPPSPAPSTSQEGQSKQPEDDSVSPLDSVPEESGLDNDILEILGDDPTATVEYGKDIRPELAARFNHIATNGLDKDNRKELCDKYLIPRNCSLIGAPALNAEIKVALNENTVKRDKLIESRQKRIAAAISSIGEAISHALEATEKDNAQIKRLMDTARLICDAQYNDSVSRRNLAVYSLKKEMKEPLLDTKIDKSLFGENLTDSLKTAKAVTKSGTELKTQFKPQTKNWKPPVAGRRQPATPRRYTPAAPTTPAQPARPPPPTAEPRAARNYSWRKPPPPPPRSARRRY